MENEKPTPVTTDELSAVVKAALEGSNLNLAEVSKALGELKDRKSLSAEEVASVVDAKLDSKLSEVTKAFEATTKAIETAAKDRETSKSKMEFQVEKAADAFDVSFPISHRAGNLSVAAKQLLNVCQRKHQDADIPDSVLQEAVSNGRKTLHKLHESFRMGTKTLTTTGSGTGAELIPTDLASRIQLRLYLESQLASEMIGNEIDMPTNPYQIPMSLARPTMYLASQGVTVTKAPPTTSRPTLTASKIMGIADYTYEIDEDSIVPVLPWLEQQLASSAADALEGAIINGDTTGTHQDSDIHAVSGHYAKAFKGFRKLALAGSCSTSLASGGISTANLAAIRKSMAKYGIRTQDLRWIVGPKGYNDIVALTETLTAEKAGIQNARILTGNAPTFFGVPVLVSSQCREDLNASGVYDGSTTTKGSLFLVYMPGFLLGVRGQFGLEVDVDRLTQTNNVIASFRRDMQPVETPSTTVPIVWAGYNFTA